MASKLQSQILTYLKSLPRCWCIKVISANERGCPDILCCYRGYFVVIEVKEGLDRLKPIQKEQLRAIGRADGIRIVAEHYGVFKDIFENVVRMAIDSKENKL